MLRASSVVLLFAARASHTTEDFPAPSPPAQPPAPPWLPPPITVRVSAGRWPEEISWLLACGGGDIQHSGGAPYSSSIFLEPGLSCSLTMRDSYGDGWNGALWEGLGQTLQLDSGFEQTTTFIVHPPPLLPLSPPPAPPAAPPPPSPAPPDLSFWTLGYTDLGVGPANDPECVTKWRRGAISHDGSVVFAPTKYVNTIVIRSLEERLAVPRMAPGAVCAGRSQPRIRIASLSPQKLHRHLRPSAPRLYRRQRADVAGPDRRLEQPV